MTIKPTIVSKKTVYKLFKVAKYTKLKYVSRVTKPKVVSKKNKVTVIRKAKKVSSRLPRTKIKLGRVNLFIENERWHDEVDLPQYPVENGLAITDHVERQPRKIDLKGIYFGDSKYTVVEKMKILNNYKNKGTRLTYAGCRSGTNFAIQKIETDTTNEIVNGTPFTITLLEIRIVGKKRKKKKATKSKSNSGRKQTTNAKTRKYHTIKRGDNYWDLGIKYGIAWKTLFNWNKYPIYFLPIGKRMRVK